jgi:glycosyltransferase involved in cell wall biosynthesis
MRPSATVIIPTYNQPAFLDLVLLSFRVQHERGFEVIVADDGSGPETKEVIDRHAQEGGLSLRHVWHEDDGFRKTIILNKAVKLAATEVLIFNDGDCLAHPRFVESHLAACRKGRFQVGRTPRLSRKLSARVTRETVLRGATQRMSAAKIWDGLFGESRKMEFGLYLGTEWIFRTVQRTKRILDLWGGNFSCWKADYVEVNGFNEEFLGWGKEDLELGIRLRNLGLQPYSLANRAINWHLWHPKPRGRAYNVQLQNRLKQHYRESGEYRCPIGYDRR